MSLFFMGSLCACEAERGELRIDRWPVRYWLTREWRIDIRTGLRIWDARAASVRRGLLAREPEQLLAVLAPLLVDEDARVRGWAVYLLARVRPNNRVPVGSMVALLRDPNDRVRNTAADSLGELGDFAREALPELRELAADASGKPYFRSLCKRVAERIEGAPGAAP